MNNVPPDHERPDDADELYRRASALDPTRPSEAVRRAVLEHAARLARQRVPEPARDLRPSLRALFAYAGRRSAAFGTLAAAVVAGLLILPTWRMLSSRFEERRAASAAQYVTVTAARTESAAPSAPPQPAPAAELPAPSPSVVPERAFKRSDASRSGREQSEYLAELQAAPPAAALPPGGTSGSVAAAADSVRSFGPRSIPTTPMSAPVTPPAAETQARGLLREELAAGKSTEPKAADANTLNEVVVTRSLRQRALAAQENDPAEAFRRAAETGDLVSLEALLGKQSNIDAADGEGRSALMRAILAGQPQAVDALLAYGANPNLPDRSGTTPLAAALAGKNVTLVEALRRHGAH